MRLANRKRPSSERGFALVTALMACAILFALAMLIIQLSIGDLQVSSKNVGDKKAAIAAEAGVHRLMRNFDPENMAAAQVNAAQVNAAADPNSRYTIGSVGRPASGPDALPLKGYSIGGGQQWGQRRYMGSVTGVNENYKSAVTIDVGIGYGPIEITTMSR
jgi:Tfp pilus assembly protein PilX